MAGPVGAGSYRAAETLLLSECGPEVMQVLRPHIGALVSIADLVSVNPQIRPFLRYIGEVHARLNVAGATLQRWRTQCNSAEAQLQEARAEIEALRAFVKHERERADGLEAQLASVSRTAETSEGDRRIVEERLSTEVQQYQAQVMRLSQQGMAQNQALAQEQAAKVAWAQEISRLRVELEVTGSMGRQHAAALEVARRQAANSDITAEHASQERARFEALLRQATREQHTELMSASESATAEAARMRARVDGARNELQGVRNAFAGREALWSEIRSIAPSVALAAEFLRDPDSPAAQAVQQGPRLSAGGLPPVRIPVLALRWRPAAAIDTTPLWSAVRAGLFCLFHQLQSGGLQPEEVELTVCCADGRWFCSRVEEDDKFAALLLYQALHRDVPVSATCRIGTVHALLETPKAELAAASGLSVRCTSALWRTPPLDEEDFFRVFMRDSPLWDAVEDFLYQRRRARVDEAFQAKSKLEPITSVMDVPGPLRVPPVDRPAQKAQHRPRAVI